MLEYKIATFKKPEIMHLNAIESHLKKMNISPEGSIGDLLTIERSTFCVPEEIKNIICNFLENDYVENIEDSKNEAWDFEYIATEVKGRVSVNARLYSDDPTKGDIYYGMDIIKGNNGYFVWSPE